jgi:hypothetical protein
MSNPWTQDVRKLLKQNFWMARKYWMRFAELLGTNSVYPCDIVNLKQLYHGYLQRSSIHDDVKEALLNPGSTLRGSAFDELAGDEKVRVEEVPEPMRDEYWRRRWIQLARQKKCSKEEFTDAIMWLVETDAHFLRKEPEWVRSQRQ